MKNQIALAIFLLSSLFAFNSANAGDIFTCGSVESFEKILRFRVSDDLKLTVSKTGYSNGPLVLVSKPTLWKKGSHSKVESTTIDGQIIIQSNEQEKLVLVSDDAQKYRLLLTLVPSTSKKINEVLFHGRLLTIDGVDVPESKNFIPGLTVNSLECWTTKSVFEWLLK